MENGRRDGTKIQKFTEIPAVNRNERTVSYYVNQSIPIFLRAYILFKLSEAPRRKDNYSEVWSHSDHTLFKNKIGAIKQSKSEKETEIKIPDESTVRKIFDEQKQEIINIVKCIDEANRDNEKNILEFIKKQQIEPYFPDFFYKRIIKNS